MTSRRARILLIVIPCWAAALALAASLDTSVLHWVAEHPLSHGALCVWRILRAPGNYFFTLTLAAIVLAVTRGDWRGAFLPCLAGAVGGVVNWVLKWCVGRTRPFHGVAPFALHPFPMGITGLWRAGALSFASGDTTLAFATAAALTSCFPRGRWLYFAWAVVVGLQRVRVGAHYPSDVVAGAALGIAMAAVAVRLWPAAGPLQAPRSSP